MANVSVSLLKLAQPASSATGDARVESAQDFSLLLASGQGAGDQNLKKRRPDELQGNLFAQPMLLPDVMPQRLSPGRGSVEASPEPEVDNIQPQTATPQAPERRLASRRAASESREDAGETTAPQRPAAQNSNDTGSKKQISQERDAAEVSEVSSAESPAISTATNPAETEPSKEVSKLADEMQKQLAAMLASGNFAGLLSLLREFVAQLQSLAQGQPAAVAVQLGSGTFQTETQSGGAAPMNGQAFLLQLSAQLQGLVSQNASSLTLPPEGSFSQSQLAMLARQLQAAIASWQSSRQSPGAQSSNPTDTSSLAQTLQTLRAVLASAMNDSVASFQAAEVATPAATTPIPAASAEAVVLRPQDIPVTASEPSTALSSVAGEADRSVAPVLSSPAQAPSSSQTAVQNPSQAETLLASQAVVASGQASLSDGEGSGSEGRSSQAPLQAIGQPSTAPADASHGRVHTAAFSRLLQPQPSQPVADQVAVQIKTALRDGSSSITIQLDPVELGKLDIKLHVASDGRTQVVITADNKETLALLQKDSSGLERALSDAGLKADSGSLSFNLRQGHSQQESGHQYARESYLKTMPDEEEVPPASVIARNYMVSLTEGIDIKI